MQDSIYDTLNEPFDNVFNQYKHLWTYSESMFFDAYQNELNEIDRRLFIRLLVRKTGQIYSMYETIQRYWNLGTSAGDSSIVTDNQMKRCQHDVQKAIQRLLNSNFLTAYSALLDDEFNSIKRLNTVKLRKLASLIPDGMDALRTHKTKAQILDWILTRLTNHGHTVNMLTRETLLQAVQRNIQKIDSPEDSDTMFTINSSVERFFKRLILLNTLLTENFSYTSKNDKSIHKKTITSRIIGAQNNIEYIDNHTIYGSCTIFDNLDEIASYENSIELYEKIRNIDNEPELITYGIQCISELKPYVPSNIGDEDIIQLINEYVCYNECGRLVGKLSKLDLFRQQFRQEYLHAKSLQYIIDQLVGYKNYYTASRFRIILALTDVGVYHNLTGENIYRAMFELHNTNKDKLAVNWGLLTFDRILEMEPSFSIKYLRKFLSILRYYKQTKLLNNTVEIRRRSIEAPVGIYHTLNEAVTTCKTSNIVKIPKLLDLTMPIMIIESNEVYRDNSSRTLFRNHADSALVTVEEYVITELASRHDSCKNAIAVHDEGLAIIEGISLLCFPVCFKRGFHEDNANSILGFNQLYPVNFSRTWFQDRQDAIVKWMDKHDQLTKADIIALLSIQGAFLYEVRFLNLKWKSLFNNHEIKQTMGILKEAALTSYYSLSDSANANSSLTYEDGCCTPIRTKRNELRMTPPKSLRSPAGTPSSQLAGRPLQASVSVIKEKYSHTNPMLGYRRPLFMKSMHGEREIPSDTEREQICSGIAYGAMLGIYLAGIPTKTRRGILYYLLQNWSYWQHGLPDLTITTDIVSCGHSDSATAEESRPEGYKVGPGVREMLNVCLEYKDDDIINKNIRIVEDVMKCIRCQGARTSAIEVKGPGDALSDKQRLWLNFMHTSGMECFVCHVQDSRHDKGTRNKNCLKRSFSAAIESESTRESVES